MTPTEQMATILPTVRHPTTPTGFSLERPAPGTTGASAALGIHSALWEPITRHEERDVITAFRPSVQSDMCSVLGSPLCTQAWKIQSSLLCI